jgi:UMF1 family MFS transporter
VLGALVLLIVSSVAILSVDAGHVGIWIAVAGPVVGDGLFAAPGERFYLLFGALIGLAAGPLQSASRSLMVRIAPPQHMTQFFGLYAMSGKLTSIAAPFTVAVVTAWSGSQRIGIAALVGFFLVGAVLLLGVVPRRP